MAAMSPSIQAITFDLWDTVVVDDSDEAKRTAMNLPSKREVLPVLSCLIGLTHGFSACLFDRDRSKSIIIAQKQSLW